MQNKATHPNAIAINKLRAIGVHRRFNLDHEFDPHVNIIHGANGTGKTTLLHIIANALNGDYQRFAYLQFDQIRISLFSGDEIIISRTGDNKDSTISVEAGGSIRDQFTLEQVMAAERARHEGSTDDIFRREKFPAAAAYFPAFRTMLEAWASTDESEYNPYARESLQGAMRSGPVRATRLARGLFGHFVPKVNFPSPTEIEERLSEEIRQAVLTVAATDRQLLSEAFVDIFASLSQQDTIGPQLQSEKALEETKALSEKLEKFPIQGEHSAENVYTRLRSLVHSFQWRPEATQVSRILDVYRQSLAKRVAVQEDSFRETERYLASVNAFLSPSKRIQLRKTKEPARRRIAKSEPLVELAFESGPPTRLSALSSGERQIATLIYATTHMSSQDVVLIDEPELSLHVDWQRLLLRRMAEQMPARQVIACTHSPVIAAEYRMSELIPSPYNPRESMERTVQASDGDEE